ncbi:BAG family molecular chaperone regulator 2 [Aphelenchoides besseyi]|nr:BAG family molecular chaperone regulator 2 [Aphelenchoides besseyi]
MSDMDWDNGRGLPRSFVDDPFFQQHHHQRNSPSADFFRDFPTGASGGPTRRFGSNPRIFNDGAPHYFDDFDRPDFNSLPRRSNSQSRSPRPPSAAERPIHIQRQGVPPFPTSNVSPQPQRKAENEPKKPPSAKPAVEINNASSSGYTNGKLNPDRVAADAAIAEGQSVANSENSSDHSSERARQNSGETQSSTGSDGQNTMHSSNGSTKSQNGMPTSNGNNESRRPPFERKTSVDGRCDQLISLLDETEKRVEMMRDLAAKLEIEKEQILDVLCNLKLNSDILQLGEGEREDLNLTADRILKRCKAVDVVVNTPRSEEQTRALDEVNNLIQNVTQKMQDDLNSSKDGILQTVQRFLNACSPDEPSGPIDQRFQSKVVECTADDQKKIRRRLAQIITQIDRAERACVPNF